VAARRGASRLLEASGILSGRPTARVIFNSSRTGSSELFWQTADGTIQAEQLTQATGAGELLLPHAVSPGGDLLVYEVINQPESSLWTLSLREKKATRLKGISATNLRMSPAFSPDGRWLAYVSNANDRTTVFVEPWPRTGVKYQLVSAPGDSPHEMVWSPDGKELFYNPRPNA
jgi:Tol biopolymer transport system component